MDIDASLFGHDDLQVAYERVRGLSVGLPPGEPPDLGGALGEDQSAVADLLATLALDVRPLADPADLVALLDVARIDREIDDVRRQLQQVDRDTDEERYSELWQRLIALEQQKRDRRGDQ